MSIKQRFHYIDALRACALFLIILYHYEVDIITSGLCNLMDFGIGYETANIHMAKVGVTLFFMVSGFGLMYSSLDSFSLKEFVKKRVLRIYIPFYVVSLLVFLCKAVMTGGAVFENEIPTWHVIFTVLGLDGYLAEYGVATFSLGVGEWFIGCMIGMYLCFPLLRKALKKNANLTIMLATVAYIVIVWVYHGAVPAHYFFPIKLYDFVLGMYFAIKLSGERKGENAVLNYKRIAKLELIVCVTGGVVLLLLMLLPVTMPVKPEYVHTVFCTWAFYVAYHLEQISVARNMFASKPIKLLSKYSYEMFLIHHWGLIMMNRVLKPKSIPMIGLCFALEVVVIFIGGAVLKEVLDKVIYLAKGRNWGSKR